MTGAILSGGIQNVGGMAPTIARVNGTIVANKGQQIVYSGGIASGTTVLSGGTIVFAGGKASSLSLKNGATIDLRELAFSGADTVKFVENAAKTGGTLTVTAGGIKPVLNLFGQYVAAGFSLSTDGIGGTDVHYKPISGAHTPLAPHH
jgi:autotransporter passenger strand-loop-strand repeat protein